MFKKKIKMQESGVSGLFFNNLILFFFFLFVLSMMHYLQDLSSPSRD